MARGIGSFSDIANDPFSRTDEQMFFDNWISFAFATCFLSIKRKLHTESSLNALIRLLIEISTPGNEKQM